MLSIKSYQIIFKLLLVLISIGCESAKTQDLDSNNQIIHHDGYTLSYNEECEQANWVYYQIIGSNLENKIAIRRNQFKKDILITTGSADPLDYYKSGYDRGHIAPSASFIHDQSLNDETFLMSNMSPQHPSFNRGIWKKLETLERNIAKDLDTLYVIAGPLLDSISETIGENQVCVPKYYYKIFIDSDLNIVDCYIMKNEKSTRKLDEFKVDIIDIEKRSGIEVSKDILEVY